MKGNNPFREILTDVKPIKFKEPLAETLGAFKSEGAVLEYTFTDVIKMAGHVCPTVAGAYIACQTALEKLYPDGIPVRGDIAVTIYAEPDEGVVGVISQVFSYLTGAAAVTGFKGLGHKFKRKDLLKFKGRGNGAVSFEFKRLDNNKSISLTLSPSPFPANKQKRIGELLEKTIWNAATKDEIKEFQDLWIEKVTTILKKNEINKWLEIKQGGAE